MVNVFSYCLYGPNNPRYYIPLLENIKLISSYFMGWRVRIYVAPDVDPQYKEVLKTYQNVDIIETDIYGEPNMIQRFYAIDEPDVDVMMVRDADSLVHWKDRWAIYEFLKSDYVAHTIRDHKDHTSKLMGGLWGIRKSSGINIHHEYEEYLKHPSDFGIAHDQNFLTGQLYSKIKDNLLVHYSNGRSFQGEHSVEFPFQWSEDLYCGQIHMKPKVIPFYHSLPRK